MAVQKCTMLMQVTTAPDDRAAASPHTGGWSESFWSAEVFPASNTFWQSLLTARARLLPAQASIVGYRFGVYTIVGNRFVPGGSSTGRLQMPGQSGYITDLPQVALEFAGTSTGTANNSRFSARCIPDDMCKQGEYQPSGAFSRSVTWYAGTLVQGGWRFVGRDLEKPVQRVLSIAGNTVTLNGAIGAVIGTDSMRLLNVKDTQANPVKGAFRIVGFEPPGTYTVIGLTGVTAGESGSARVDAPILCDFATVTPIRAVVRKIGRPFESYRGRASRR